jgi:microcystin-dependent protein
MTAQILAHNVTAFAAPFDSSKTNVAEPTPTQMANGFLPNVDNVTAEHHNFLGNTSTSLIWLMQKLGLMLPFNPDGLGLSKVAIKKGGVISIEDSVTGETKFYVANSDRAVGFGDPSLDPTNFSIINFGTIATYTDPYSDGGGTADAITGTYNSMIYPVLKDGLRLTVDIPSPNLTTAPTFQPTLNGSTQTARVIQKRGANGSLIPLAPGDLVGVCVFTYHLGATIWELLNPPRHQVLPGSVIVWAGATAPAGYLQLPNALANVSRTAYADLFSAIGTQWGVGDGATTFGLPWLPAAYAILQAAGMAGVGAQTIGQVINHIHTVPFNFGSTLGGTSLNANGNTIGSSAYTTNNPTGGGAANLAAGVGFMLCIKY